MTTRSGVVNLSEALAEFADMVDSKLYSRLPYSSWQELNRLAKTAPTIEFRVGRDKWNDRFIEFQSGTRTIKIDEPNEDWDGFREFFIDSVYADRKPSWTGWTETSKKKTIEKENDNTMKMPTMNVEFGPCGDGIALSPYGLAIKNKDSWITYNAAMGKTVDVTGFTFNFGKFIFKMPAAVRDIKPNDLVMHQNKAVYVTDVSENKLTVIDILASEEKTVIPVSNMFGFDFVTKVVCLMNMDGTQPSAAQPFGNIMPMMMWSMLLGDDDKNSRGGDNDFFGNMDLGKFMLMMSLTGAMGQSVANPFASMFAMVPNFTAGQAPETTNS